MFNTRDKSGISAHPCIILYVSTALSIISLLLFINFIITYFYSSFLFLLQNLFYHPQIDCTLYKKQEIQISSSNTKEFRIRVE